MKINSKKLSFKSADNKEISYIQYEPEGIVSSSVIVIYEVFGMTKHIKNFGKSLAEKGFLVNIPDIYSRLESNLVFEYNQEGLKKGLEHKEKLGWELPVMDIVSCASNFKIDYKVASLGFCYGGSLSWLVAQRSFIFDTSVCYYGSSIPDFLERDLNCPTLVHFAKKDKGIPQEAVKNVLNYANSQKVEVNVIEYEDADHGFNCEDRKSYNKNASETSFENTIDFLMENNNDI